MSGEILTTIITVLSIFGFMYRQTALLSAEIKEVRADIAGVDKRLSADIAAVDKRQSERLSAEIKEVRADIAAVDKRQSERLSAEIKEVRADIAAVNERLSAEIAAVDKRLSHTDGLVEGLSRALLSTQAPAQTQAQALA